MIEINAWLQRKHTVTFFGRLSFDTSKTLEAFKEGRSNAKVTLIRYARTEKEQFIGVKERSVKQKGDIANIGKWEIPLETIQDGKYYIKFTINKDVFSFAKLGTDSDINERGNTAPTSVVYGGKYEVKAAIKYKITQIEPTHLAPLTDGVHINVGGPDFSDKRGTIWTGHETAAIYSSGMPYTIADSIPIHGTDMQDLYRSEVYFARKKINAPPMTFEVPVRPGDYIIRLHFSEIWKKALVSSMCASKARWSGRTLTFSKRREADTLHW